MRKRIILDTNLWISFLISKRLDFLDNYILNQEVTLVFSEELIGEFLSVTNRPSLKRFFTDREIVRLLNRFDEYGEIVSVRSNIQECRDPKDNFLLNLAVDSKADALVTGDKDLLSLKTIEKTQILSMRTFLDQLDKKE